MRSEDLPPADRHTLRFRWREGGEPFEDLALEELLLEEGSRGAVLWTYAWPNPVLVLGYGQPPSEVDPAPCLRLGVPILRRITGGSAVLHEGGRSLSLSLALPADHPWARGIHSLYAAFVSAIAEAVGGLGAEVRPWRPGDGSPRRRSPICFEDHRGETLLSGGRKVLGCAQTRRRRAVLVHGALLFGLNAPFQARVFGVEPDRILAAMGALPARPGLDASSAARAVCRSCARALGASAVEEAPPELPPALRARRGDPKWVISPRPAVP
ncbi:MAG: lipoate--protein ligase family protein [Acidobacteriota bacterium]